MGKFSIAAMAAMASTAAAFPAGTEHIVRAAKAAGIQQRATYNSGAGTVPDVGAVFDAEKQYISTSGEYAWVAPGETDQRGPCPGLNAMANHGYLPHNGIATIAQYIQATNTVVGMGLDLAGFLAIYGAIFNGNLVSWSMGGPDARVSLGALATQGEPAGLSGSHDNYENDVSPTRGDLYQYGNDYVVVPDQFKELYNRQGNETEETSNYNLEILQQHRSDRWDASVANNPDFFNPPFAGVLVQPAAYTFIYRFMANHSAEYPDGRLSQNVLKSWFAMTGPDENGEFTNTHGYERIPDNWYRRTVGDEYTIPFFILDVLQEALVYPKFLDIGGNVNGTNTFTGVDVENLTGGVYNSLNLVEGNNLQCFIFGFLALEAPDLLIGLLEAGADALSMLLESISNSTEGLNCPKLQNSTNNQFDIYPGYTRTSDNNFSRK